MKCYGILLVIENLNIVHNLVKLLSRAKEQPFGTLCKNFRKKITQKNAPHFCEAPGIGEVYRGLFYRCHLLRGLDHFKLPCEEIQSLLRHENLDDRERFVVVSVDQLLFQLEVTPVNILLFRLIAVAEEYPSLAEPLEERVAAKW